MSCKQLRDDTRLPGWRQSGARWCACLACPLIGLGRWLGQVSSWLVLGVMMAVLATVLMNALGINELMRWDDKVLLLGKAITINTVTELQWHLFGVLTLLGAGYAMHANMHVRVDMLHHRMSPALKHWVEIVGHLVLLIPFCILIAWLSKHMVQMSYVSGEQSNYGGLTDRFLIKGALPTGLLLLALGALGQVFDRLARILDPARDVEENSDAG
ncbi:TRAP transporter small permease subunit [Marinobacterium marinum]|uniref:TRAP transporter small permease protein n=1 Tax=Marinobacterium marinum TaxID=2756129 RepID=A0A7W1WZF9_9GAMM|nr:TRAP transporter small permease subunit [Marinobacterium marinum]MBA4503065.1 TRAP transporter small permease subunit [Marinobacterium marinum]